MHRKAFLLAALFFFFPFHSANAEHGVFAAPAARAALLNYGERLAFARQQLLLAYPGMSLRQADFYAERILAGFPVPFRVPPVIIPYVVVTRPVVAPRPVLLPRR